MGLELDGVNGIIKNSTSDGDVTIKGNDGGSEISALTFDMSAEGAATFNSSVTLKDAGGGAGAILNLTSADTSGASGEFLGIINFVSSDSSTGSAGTQAAIKGVYEDNGDSSGLEFFTGNSTGSGTPTLQKRMQMFHDSGVTITTTDNTDTLTLASTDADANSGPNLRLYRNSGSPADSDLIGNVQFEGRNDNSQDVVYAEISSRLNDASDGTEDGLIFIKAMTGGTLTEYMRFDPGSGGIVVNDGSIDMNFRVESNGKDDMLFVDGGENRIGIGTSSPTRFVQLTDTSADMYLAFEGGTSNTVGILLGDTDDHTQSRIQHDNSDNSLKFSTVQTEAMRIDSSQKVGIGETSPLGLLHVKTSDSGATVNANRDDFVIENSGHCGMTILSGTSSVGGIGFGDSGGNLQGLIQYNHSTDNMEFNTNSSSNPLMLHDTGQLSSNGELDTNVDPGGLCLNHGANDGRVLSFKNSDVSHSMTTIAQADTYGTFGKNSSSTGGLFIQGISESTFPFTLRGAGNNTDTSKSGSSAGFIMLEAAQFNGSTSVASPASNVNLVTIRSGTDDCVFIFDEEGDFHADNSSTTFDAFEDAQLARAYDLSHGKGVINSKFDKFVSYNADKLADLKLIGRDKDGTPNSHVNVTGMQRLHNGAIWQQYEKHQRLAEAVYEMAKEALGEDKANAILEKHDIKLLN
jgi:hypothetical protein